MDSSLFGAAPIRLSSGGILTAGLGFSGTLANLFLTSNIVEYSSLTLNETCFTPDDLIATLKPTNLISNQGGATFAESKFVANRICHLRVLDSNSINEYRVQNGVRGVFGTSVRPRAVAGGAFGGASAWAATRLIQAAWASFTSKRSV